MTGITEAKILWERAVATFEDAQAVKHPHSIANRSYYAAFYAVSALFALEDVAFRKHQQVEAAVHRDLVLPGKWSKELGDGYSSLMEFRTTGDYGIVNSVTPVEAKEAIEIARDILKSVHEAHPDIFPLPLDNP
ncbi:MAG: HEPN domain-containing protein [bacterium]